MRKPNFHPSYIPRKWIHYADHSKKKRIRKKYQNRIRRTINQHAPDIETMTYKIRSMSLKCGYTTDELRNAIVSAGRMFRNSTPITPQVIESINIPENNTLIVDYEPRVEIPGDIQRLNDAIEELKAALQTALEPVIEAIHKIIDKFTKWARDLFDRIWCSNRHWWNMANHHKKYRIRKKYRNKIKRMARTRLGELLHSLESDDSEDQDEASDDEEVP